MLTRILAVFAIGTLAAGCGLLSVPEATSSSAYKIATDFQDSSAYPAGTSLSISIHVTQDGAAVGYATVGWAVLSGHGRLSDTISTTDTLGATHIVWTLGNSPEANALVFGAGGTVDTLKVTGTVGPPSYLVILGAQSDTVTAGVPLVLQVVVKDRPGNSVPGASVIWTSSGGKLSTPNSVSDSTGTATAGFAASDRGSFHVTADLPDRATCVFEVVVR